MNLAHVWAMADKFIPVQRNPLTGVFRAMFPQPVIFPLIVFFWGESYLAVFCGLGCIVYVFGQQSP